VRLYGAVFIPYSKHPRYQVQELRNGQTVVVNPVRQIKKALMVALGLSGRGWTSYRKALKREWKQRNA
jgi:hypothetical protein